jgi:hypothetical protein
MAGGPNAQTVPCMQCFARAERTGEGLEDDLYCCEAGHAFGIDWSVDGSPPTPRWPPSDAERALFEKFRAFRDGNG